VELDLETLTTIEIDRNSIKSDDTRAEGACRVCSWNILSCHKGAGPAIHPFQRKLCGQDWGAKCIDMSRLSKGSKGLPRNKANASPNGSFKAVKALRDRGVKVYNFLVNTDGASAEADLYFL
jgi:hypothetical protein